MAARSPVTLPGHHAGRPLGHTLPPEVLTPEEARALLRVPSPRAPTGIRNRALLAVLYRSGLRISEALALEQRDLHAAACTLTVRHGKGNRHRTIGMDPAAVALVARWLDERLRLGVHRPSVVFCTLDGRPLQASYVRALLPRLARKAGIEKRVHPHGLRHTCAAELAIEGCARAAHSAAAGPCQPAHHHGQSAPHRPCGAGREDARAELESVKATALCLEQMVADG